MPDIKISVKSMKSRSTALSNKQTHTPRADDGVTDASDFFSRELEPKAVDGATNRHIHDQQSHT